MLRNSNWAGVCRWVQFNSQAMLQALQRGWQAMVVSLLSNFAGFLIFAYIFFYTDKHNVIRLMYLYACTNAFGAVVGICLLIYPLLRLYKKSKIQRAQIQQENKNINKTENEIQLHELKNTSSSKIYNKKKSKELKNSASKFESKYTDLESSIKNLSSLNPVDNKDYETKDQSSDNTDEAKKLPEL